MKGTNHHFKEKLKKKWPAPLVVRLDGCSLNARKEGTRVRYRVYPNADELENFMVRIALFSDRGTILQDDEVPRRIEHRWLQTKT